MSGNREFDSVRIREGIEIQPDGRVLFTSLAALGVTKRLQIVQRNSTHLVTFEKGRPGLPARFEVWELSQDETEAVRLIGFDSRWARRSNP